MKKHYDSNYLDYVYDLAKNTKQKSYEYFKNIKQGLIVDLGCGTGKDVFELAEKQGNCFVLGIDYDSEIVSIAKENAKKMNFFNVSFKEGYAENIALSDNSVSGLRSERVFQHLLNQQRVLKEIHRCLISQGTLVIVETDWISMTVYNEFPELISRMQNFLVSKKVNNGFATRHLFSDIEKCGFKMVQVEVEPLVIKTLQRANQFFKVEQVVDEMTALGLFSEEEKLNLKDSFFELDKNNHFNLTINTLIFHAVKS